MRSRLHRWPWRQLQQFVEYKGKAEGIAVIYVSPAYSSLTCSNCGSLGSRHKHQFKCPHCGSLLHSDRNAAINHRKLAEFVDSVTASVNVPMVAVQTSYKLLPLGKGFLLIYRINVKRNYSDTYTFTKSNMDLRGGI